MNVIYIVDRFPTYSETFIHDEIVNHLQSGIDIRVCVLSRRESADFSIEDDGHAHLRSRVCYLDLSTSEGWGSGARLVIAGALSALRAGKSWQVLRALRAGQLSLRELMLGAVIARKFPKVTIIHCHFGNIGRIGLAAARLSDARPALFVTFHAYEMTKRWFLPLERYYRALFQSEARLLPISDHWRSILIDAGADPRRIATHRMGVRLPTGAGATQPATNLSDALRIVQVGRMVEKKGHAVSIEALALLRQRRPDIGFTCDFIGSGPLEAALRERAVSLGLADVVRFHGSMQHTAVLQAVTASDLFLLPSVTASDGDKEGIPVALMEAMAHGVPVVSTHHSGIPELVEDGVTGLLTEERDAHGLAAAIERIALDPDLRRRLATAGGERVKDAFNQEVLGDQLRQRYRDALHSRA